MITREILEKAYDAGIVRLINSPTNGKAIVGIGDEWNFLYCNDTYDCTAAEVIKKFSKDYILDGIFEMLETFRDPDDGDRTYEEYEKIIFEGLFPEVKIYNNMRFVADKITEIFTKAGNIKCSYCVVNDDYLSRFESRKIPRDIDGAELERGMSYMYLTCDYGSEAYINVTHDSIPEACMKVFYALVD